MNTYFGQISIRNEYVNFRPMYLYENGRFEFLNADKLNLRFPDTYKGEINFICVGRYEEKNFKDGEYLFLDIDDGALEDNLRFDGRRNPTGYKIEVSKSENKRVHSPDSMGCYCILTDDDYEGDYKKSSILTVVNDHVYFGLKVYIECENDNEFLGPFEVVKSSIGSDRLTLCPCNNNKKQYYEGRKFHAVEYLGWQRGEQELRFTKVNDDAEVFYLDCSTDEQLLTSFLSTIDEKFVENGKIDLNSVSDLLESRKTSLFVGIPDVIKEKRYLRLKKIITDEQYINEKTSNISSLFCSFLESNKDKEQYNHLIGELTNKPEIIEKIQRFKIVQEKIEKEELKLQKLHDQCDSLQKDIDAKAQEKTDALLEDKKHEVDLLSQQKEVLLKEIEGLNEVSRLNEKTQKLKADVDYRERRRDELDHQIKDIEKRFGTFFEESAERVVKFTFDGMLADRVSQLACEWKKDNVHKHYEEIVNDLKNTPHLAQTGEDLVNYLVDKIKEYRPNYSRNAILNILICYAQGFLTVFSGEPGTGKTSICNIMANALGLNFPQEKKECSRFISVSVERGWTTKRDFIGYFNPLTKSFDKSNHTVFDALNILDIEAKDSIGSDSPFVVLLDEANLSPMEYYWADFMNVCDDFDCGKNINLGDSFTFKIAKCMRFLATINNDHTTESLSPRLIDRAWIIRLPESRNISLVDANFDYSNLVVSWTNFYNVFGNSYGKEKIDGMAGNIFDDLLKKCKDAKINISPRVVKAVSRYWFAAQELFESTETDASIVALDYAVAQRILPHINGNGLAYKEKLESLQEFCNQKNLQMSSEIIKEIVQKGVESMHYFQYFA